MLFSDGNRIDLSIEFTQYIDDGEPVVVLLDKDGFQPDIKPDPRYWYIKQPSEKIYTDTCNEFWWCLNNVAKGIARDELTYAMDMFNHYVRDMLNQMVEWVIGIHTGFSVSAGKMGKNFKQYLPKDLYDMYAKTYSNSDYEHLWASILTACELFRSLAIQVAEYFDYSYNNREDENMMRYIKNVKNYCDKAEGVF